ncbi:MAG: hypothetical protein MAG431_00288 [Chloroflexi bacterium]|nr:hypothetical protein [Chloroflexota bacterium]
MRNFGHASIDEFLDDFVVFRNLIPIDKRLPSVDDLRSLVNIPAGITPRKSQPAYAQVIVEILKEAKALDATNLSIKRLIYLGDTLLNDGTAFINIARAGNWPGLAFIASEQDDPSPAVVEKRKEGTLYIANHWRGLKDFDSYCQKENFPIDRQTAVIVDIDKTALGARGRNDHLINQARVDAARHTVEDLLGGAFDIKAFQRNYQEIDQVEFHPFTTDNQDYLAYICLILGSGLYQLNPLLDRIRAGELDSFQQFIAAVDERAEELPPSLNEIHQKIYARVRTGDPTPFKAFRYNEFHATIDRMGCSTRDISVEALLANEIVITQEVRAAALRWKEKGALLFGLSDKPDEASVPTPALAAKGYQPVHRVKSHAVGEA